MPASPPPPLSANVAARLQVLAMSYARLAGRPLIPPAADIVAALWTHPAAIVAHGTQNDPVFFFGNRRALELFEMTFDAFAALPSRLSAEPLLRDERERLLARVTADGIISDYSGVRISATGRRFRIEQAAVWNLIDEAGVRHGQAALFDRWTRLS